MFKTLKYFFVKYLLLLSTMFFTRIIFLIYNVKELKQEIPNFIIIKSFYVGVIFDLSVSAYFLMPFIILYIIYIFINNFSEKIGKIFLKIYSTIFFIASFLIIFALIVDAEYYKTFSYHINPTINDYTDNFSEIFSTILSDYNVVLNIFISILIFIPFLFFGIKNTKSIYFLEKFNLKKIIIEFALIMIIITFTVISARGGVEASVINWGRAYFSEYNFPNQMSLNGVFYYLKSYSANNKDTDIKRYLSNEEINKNIKDIFYEPNVSFLKNSKNPLLRVTNTGKEEKKYNIILVLMESWVSDKIGILGGEPDLTPKFNKIAKEGILFNNFYASGTRSNRGIVAVNCAFPSQHGQAVIKKDISNMYSFISLAKILKDRGYSTNFFYGGDLEFDNMRGFLFKNGIDNFLGMKDFSGKDRNIKWGSSDDVVFNRSLEEMDKLKEPFFIEIFTLTNHEPYDAIQDFEYYKNKDDENYKKFNAYALSDKNIGDFIEKFKKTKYANNTILLFVADHGQRRAGKFPLNKNAFHIPLLIYSVNKDIIKPEIIEKVGSQTDIIPTLMNFLGGEYLHSSWGKNLMLESNNNFAYFVENNFTGLIKNDFLYIESLQTGQYLIDLKTNEALDLDLNQDTIKEMKKISKTIFELNYLQVKEGSFGER